MGPTGRFAPVGPGILKGHQGDPEGKSDELIDTSIKDRGRRALL